MAYHMLYYLLCGLGACYLSPLWGSYFIKLLGLTLGLKTSRAEWIGVVYKGDNKIYRDTHLFITILESSVMAPMLLMYPPYALCYIVYVLGAIVTYPWYVVNQYIKW